MRMILLIVLLFSFTGCQNDPFDITYTTTRPKEQDLVGCYKLTKQTVTKDGLSVLKDQPSYIKLFANGTFVARNTPPDDAGPGGSSFFSTLVSTTGKWRVDEVGIGSSISYWGIYFDSSAKVHCAYLFGESTPYGIVFILGDPDSGFTMMFQRERDQGREKSEIEE